MASSEPGTPLTGRPAPGRGRHARLAVLRWMRGERGAASTAVLGVLCASLGVTLVLMTVLAGLVQRQRVVSAADHAALAAADTSSGLVAGVVCERAAEAAARNGAELARCDPGGNSTVTVEVRSSYLGIPLTAVARAGPPPDAQPEK